jgi:hypothetical protein
VISTKINPNFQERIVQKFCEGKYSVLNVEMSESTVAEK